MTNGKTAVEYQKKLGKLEKELLALKKEGEFGSSKKNLSLKGILKGVTFTEGEIESAKASLFKPVQL